jgi:hypothetical protein
LTALFIANEDAIPTQALEYKPVRVLGYPAENANCT